MDIIQIIQKTNYIFPGWWLLAMSFIFGFLYQKQYIRMSYFVENMGYQVQERFFFHVNSNYYWKNLQILKKIIKETEHPSVRSKARKIFLRIKMFGFGMIFSMILFIINLFFFC